MAKNLFIVVKSNGNKQQRDNLRKYYDRKGHKVQFTDTVKFDHADAPSVEYAEQLCALGLIMYAALFNIKLDIRRMFSANIEIFASIIEVSVKSGQKPLDVIESEKNCESLDKMLETHDIPNLEYAMTLHKSDLYLYAEQFSLKLDRRETHESMQEEFTSFVNKIEGNSKSVVELAENLTKLVEGDNEKAPIKEIEIETATIDVPSTKLDKDNSSESNTIIESGEDMKQQNLSELNTKVITHLMSPDVPEKLICPHCGAKARTESSYIKNHGANCSRYISTK